MLGLIFISLIWLLDWPRVKKRGHSLAEGEVRLVTDPSGRAPLTAQLVLQSGLTDITVLVSDGEREWEVPHNIIALACNFRQSLA